MISRRLAISVLPSICLPLHAQTYPSKPIKLIVPYAPGGTSDVFGRLIGTALSSSLGQPVVVENKPGVGGALGMNYLAKSVPDGYTLAVAVSGTLVTGPHLQKNFPYDPLTAFEPVSMLADGPMVLVAAPNFPFNDLRSLVAYAKKNPGTLTYASHAQIFELAMQLLNMSADIQTRSIPYANGPQATVDLMAGRVSVMVDGIGVQQANIEAGKLKALAVLSERRSTALPSVPTAIESGVAGLQVNGWVGIVAPKDTPERIVKQLNLALNNIMETPEIKAKMSKLGFEVLTGTSKSFSEKIGKDYIKYGDIVKKAGLTPQ